MGYAIPISDVIERIAELMTQTTQLSESNSAQQSSQTEPSGWWPFQRWQ